MKSKNLRRRVHKKLDNRFTQLTLRQSVAKNRDIVGLLVIYQHYLTHQNIRHENI